MTLEACEKIRRFERDDVGDELSKDDQMFVEGIWQQILLTICQAEVEHEKRELKLFKVWGSGAGWMGLFQAAGFDKDAIGSGG